MRVILAAGLLIVAGAAVAQEPLTFKGLELGADKAQVLAVLPNSDCRGDSCYWRAQNCKGDTDARIECAKGMSYGGVFPLWTAATFRDGKLATVMVMIKSEAFESLAEAMTQRFGKPDFDQSEIVQNRMGASFDQRGVSWMRGDVSLRLKKRSNKIDEGSVFFVSRQYIEESAAERKAATKAKAKDL